MNIKRFLVLITVFQEKVAPEEGYLVGYGAILKFYDLYAPPPDRLAIISQKHTKQYETEDWIVLTPKYMPEDSLAGRLTFALKYEGIDLGILKKLFEQVGGEEITTLIANEPSGQYSRKIWFLYEWLLDIKLEIPDLTTGNYVNLIEEKLQYATKTFDPSSAIAYGIIFRV